ATTPAAETTPPAQQSAAATPQGTNVAAAQLSPAQVPQRPTPPQSAPPQPSPSQPVRQAMNEVQGPPTPGFESVDGTAAPASTAPAPTTSQPAVAAQLNAITLARASAPPSTSSSPPPLAPSAPQPAPTTVQPLPAQQPPAQQPPAQQQQPNPEATRSLADIIRAIDVPDAERQSTVAAVDLAEVERMQTARRAERQAAADKAKKAAAAKAKAEADAKAKKEAEEKARLAANPSRNWLQIGTGANKSALAFTMRNLRKKYADIAPQDAWTASWGRTNRLLVGPFASFTRAKSLEEKLKADGADAFAWRSDAGEVVERLPGK
ncbi:SPOR domain-containing protein, partial [Sphingobium ummariense]|uniref:SPOR domain-containing protein n=1 Tax=Sphingobium ummariense TaxID=420994 RepID=UPI0004CEA741